MSRAFVKDDDDRPEPLIARGSSDAPNYVTPRGLRLLNEQLERARADGNQRDARYFEERIASAIVVTPPDDRGIVQFGASARIGDAKGRSMSVRIVGDDEASPRDGALSWQSPIAQALIGHRTGDRVTVARPAGPIQYTIDGIDYEGDLL